MSTSHDADPAATRVLYHIGRQARPLAWLQSGSLTLGPDALEIAGATPIRLPYREITFPVEPFRLHGFCRMLGIIHRGGHLLVTVPLIRIGGVCLVNHHASCVRLQEAIDLAFRTAWAAPAPALVAAR